MPTPTPTPKAVIHQKYGAKARYTVEGVREAVDGACPGLAVPQNTKSVYRCELDLPGVLNVVTPGTFHKKDAEQAAAQMALDKLGMMPTANIPSTPEEAREELIGRISFFSPMSEELLGAAVAEHGKVTVLAAVHKILDFHDAAREVERSLLELRQVFLDMAVLVESEGEQLQDIESHAVNTKDYVQSGNKELEEIRDDKRAPNVIGSREKNKRKKTF